MSTFILLRGLTRGSGHWGEFPRLLQERMTDARIMTLDLPGNGALHALESPSRIEAVSRHCREQARLADLAPPFHLFGVSLGAMVAIEWALQAPQSIAACVLVNTSLRGLNPWHHRLRPSSLASLLAIALAPNGGSYKERSILALTSRNPHAAAAVLDDWTRLRREQPVAPANALRQLLAATRYRAPARPAAPLLLLSSARDDLVNPCCSAQIADRWHCRHEVHPSGGHDLTLDDGPWVVDRVCTWLDRSGR
jgi:pimeloyl-ACP methyl ester carboxylesterase